MAEEGRISLRHARKMARDDIQARMKEHEVGEDDGHRQLDEVDRLTQEFTSRIDELLQRKEQEVMAV
jgi:ribosome recycling factor